MRLTAPYVWTLAKYFSVPMIPTPATMKIFLWAWWSNASLIIFRQLKKLSELHGSPRHFATSREICTLPSFHKDFGNKLYEEGVHEIHEYLKIDQDIPKQDIELQNCIPRLFQPRMSPPGQSKGFCHLMSSVPSKVEVSMKRRKSCWTFTYSDMMYVQKFGTTYHLWSFTKTMQSFKQYIIAHAYHGLDEAEVLKRWKTTISNFLWSLLCTRMLFEVPAQVRSHGLKELSWISWNLLAEKGFLWNRHTMVPKREFDRRE